MITELGLRWILTIAFTGVGVFCAYRCLRGGPVGSRVGDVLHVLMCAGMIAMAWPAAMDFARIPQLLVFALATVWFVGMAVFGARCHETHSRLALGHHALMMAAMAWMLLVMPTVMAGMSTTATAASGGDHAGHNMGGGLSTNTPAHVAVIAIVLAVVFLVAGIGRLARAIDLGRTHPAPRMPTTGLAADGVMSLGMALMAALLV